jgi:hypothetical protein
MPKGGRIEGIEQWSREAGTQQRKADIEFADLR